MPHSVAILFPVIRGLILAALLLLIGVAATGGLVRRTIAGIDPGVDTRVTIWLLQLPRLLGTFLLTLCLARSAAQVLSFMLPGEAFDPVFARGVMMEGGWGRANMIQLGGAALLFAGATLLRTRPRWMHRLVMLLLPVLIWGQTGMGHAVDELWPPWAGRITHAVHLVGGGLWLGTLGILAIAVLPSLRGDERLPMLARVIAAFSRTARIGAALVVASGLVAVLRYGESVGALLASTWGTLLLIKLSCFAGVLALGAWNWRRITPALERRDPGSGRQLRLAIGAELLLGTGMLATTALLVASPLPKPAGVPCTATGGVPCQPMSTKPSPVTGPLRFAASK